MTPTELPKSLPGERITLGKPSSMTDEQCSSIEAVKDVDHWGFPFFLVAFKPSPEELEALNAGGSVFIKQVGHSFHPIAVFSQHPDGEINM